MKNQDNPIQPHHLIILLASIALIVLAFIFREKLAEFKNLGLLGIFLINFFGNATVLLPAPAIATVVAGGALYPPLFVAIVSALGASLGDMVGFFLGLSGKNLFIKNHHKRYMMLKNLFHKAGDIIVLLFAFIPNPFFDVIGLAAGIFHFSPIRFFILMLLGRFVRGLLLAYLGSAVGSM